MLGLVGRLVGEKRYDRLLQALAALKRADVGLLLIGDGPEYARLEKMAVELGVSQRVYFAGWRKNVDDFLNAMDIFVLPSDFEAMPFSIIEAMACGVPVVATDVGGISDIIEDGVTGFLVPPCDISELSRCIRCLMFDEDMRQRFGREARRKAVRQFSEKEMIRQTLLLYDEVSPLNSADDEVHLAH